MSIDIGGMRKPYLGEKEFFDIKDLAAKEPYKQFENWFEVAKNTTGIVIIGNSNRDHATSFKRGRLERFTT